MTTITVTPTDAAESPGGYTATAGEFETSAPTIGQAIDALTARLPQNGATLIVIPAFRGDQFFTDAQRDRLAELMAKWRVARDTGSALPSHEQVELEALTQAELRAATARAAAMLQATP